MYRGGSPSPAHAAHDERQVRQERQLRPHQLGSGLRHHGRKFKATLKERADRRRHVRLRPVDRLGRLCRRQTDEGRPALQQPGSQCPSLHGLRGSGPCVPSAWMNPWAATTTSAGRRLRPVGLTHGEMHPHPLVAHLRSPSVPPGCAGARALHLRAPRLRAGGQRTGVHPQTDLAILSIANYIIQNDKGELGVRQQSTSSQRVTDIGYGLRPTNPAQQRPGTRTAATPAPMASTGTSSQVRGGLRSGVRLPKLSGVPRRTSSKLARRSMRIRTEGGLLLDHGFNQHTRGVWANNLCYNIHLLTGKISQPGSGPSPDRPALRLWYRP